MTIYVGTTGRYARVTTERDCLPPDAEIVVGFNGASLKGTADLYSWAGFDVDTDGETDEDAFVCHCRRCEPPQDFGDVAT